MSPPCHLNCLSSHSLFDDEALTGHKNAFQVLSLLQQSVGPAFMFPPLFYLAFSHSTSKSSVMFYLTISHTAQRTHLFYLTTSIYLSFSLSFSFPAKHTNTYTHINNVAWGGERLTKKKKNYFSPMAEGELAVSFSGNKVINKVMVPFQGKVALRCHGNSLWRRN